MRSVPPLHAVTDDGVLARPGFADAARAVLAAGGPRVALHLRGPSTSGRRLYALATALRGDAGEAGATLVVNDRADVALASGADAVQLGARSLAPADVRGMGIGEMRIGVSVHAPADLAALGETRPDWLLVGTLYATASHPGRAADGPSHLARFAGCGVPLVGIGGVTPARVGEVVRAGAAGVAVLRGIWDAPSLADAVRAYLAAFDAAAARG